MRAVRAWRITAPGGIRVAERTEVATEEAVVIAFGEASAYTVMCTPQDTVALAVGFALSEGIISGLDDVAAVERCEAEPGVVRVRLADPERAALPERNLLVVSSCGQCGSRRGVEQMVGEVPGVGQSLRVTPQVLWSVAEALQRRQPIFQRTGGTHAAVVFASDGRVLASGEDIGRHNALDKALGHCVLERIGTRGCGAMLSGRASFELVAKCARAGIELVAAVSAPSSLAVEAAEHWGITVCGFVRADRATVFTHGWRVEG